MRATCSFIRLDRIAAKPPLAITTGRMMNQPMTDRSSRTWNTLSTLVVSRPATDMVRNDAIDSAIQKAALRREGCAVMGGYLAEVAPANNC